MNYIDILCIAVEIPAVTTGTLEDMKHGTTTSAPTLEVRFMDQETGDRLDAVTEARCNLARPKHKGCFVAHVAYEDVVGIRRQVGRIEWQPLAPAYRAYLATVGAKA